MNIHEHVKIDNGIVPHNGKLYDLIIQKGLHPSWLPGISKDKPSLEDQGLLSSSNVEEGPSKKLKIVDFDKLA